MLKEDTRQGWQTTRKTNPWQARTPSGSMLILTVVPHACLIERHKSGCPAEFRRQNQNRHFRHFPTIPPLRPLPSCISQRSTSCSTSIMLRRWKRWTTRAGKHWDRVVSLPPQPVSGFATTILSTATARALENNWKYRTGLNRIPQQDRNLPSSSASHARVKPWRGLIRAGCGKQRHNIQWLDGRLERGGLSQRPRERPMISFIISLVPA